MGHAAVDAFVQITEAEPVPDQDGPVQVVEQDLLVEHRLGVRHADPGVHVRPPSASPGPTRAVDRPGAR